MKKTCALLLSLACLAGCGGGGGGGDTPATTTTSTSGSGSISSTVSSGAVTSSVIFSSVEGSASGGVISTVPETNTWSNVLDLGSKNSLFGIHTAGIYRAYVYGANETAGLLLSSDNAGQTWRSIAPAGRTAAINAVAFPAAKVGWLAGNSYNSGLNVPAQYLMKTADAGDTWTDVALPTCDNMGFSYQVTDVQFLDLSTGWVSGSCGLMHTTDGGKTWQQVGTAALGFHFFNPTQAWSRYGDTAVQRSVDGGASWTVSSFPALFPAAGVGEDMVRITATHFLDTNHAWVAMYLWGHDTDMLLVTTNGGLTWQSMTLPARMSIGGVYFENANTGWLVSSSGTLYSTTNGGSNWTLISSPSTRVPSVGRMALTNSSLLAISYGDAATSPEPFSVSSSVWRATLK